MSKEIESIIFGFENCEILKVPYEKFKIFDINNKDIHFRIEDIDIKRLYEYPDIVDIHIKYIDGSENKIQAEWSNFEDENNEYQLLDYLNNKERIIEITISKEKYLHKEIRETKKEINRLDDKLNELYTELTLI